MMNPKKMRKTLAANRPDTMTMVVPVESFEGNVDLTCPNYYIHRELSLLAFHRRVLAQTEDESMPLLERLRFLCIASTNLDEFFEVRVAALKEQIEFNSLQIGPDGISPQEALNRISSAAHEFVDMQYRLLNETMLPALEKEGIRFLKRDQWTPEQAAWVNSYFHNELLPILSPIGLDPAHPFPRILNKSLNFIVSLHGKDAFGRDTRMAVVQAPRALPRLIRFPTELSTNKYDFVFLSSIIHACVEYCFPGMKINSCHQFRVTRNSDLFVEEEVEDLLQALEGELASRRYGDSIRLEVADNCPDNMIEFLLHKFGLSRSDLFQVNGPVNLNRLAAVIDEVDRPDLKFPSFTPSTPKRLSGNHVFAAIREGDILLHHPFQSFTPVIEFVKEAAADPNVLAIKQTLYRTGADSALVEALLSAARAGKEVTVIVELRARFDEEANINLANRLQEAGAHVVYGVVGYKTHAKMLMVVRREDKKLRRYVHLGTGNYHARTAKIYTDYGLLTCDEKIGEDVHKMFMQLTTLGRGAQLERLLQSPFTLHKGMIERIEREASHARQGKPARIIAKVNALTEPNIIRSLYKASMAGVKVDLIVRGICCLRPNIPHISENITVRSIVGRFLEHTRTFYFHNDGDAEVFCSSADWMDRNLLKRVETCFPIVDPELKQRVIEQNLMWYLKDNSQAWLLNNDGSYHRVQLKEGETSFSAQMSLLNSWVG